MMNDVKMAVCLMAVLCGTVFANSSPTVTQVVASVRADGSGIVDIYYTLSDADNDRCTVNIAVSDDGGSSWNVTISPSAFSGDLTNVYPGNRHIIWNSKADLPGVFGSNYRVKVIADDSMVWVYINDPGVSGHESFNGYMSKYETTNAQYCQFLSAALASGDIIVGANNIIYGANGSNNGIDFIGEVYFNTYAADSDSQITYNGGTFSVRSCDGYDMSNHPVVEVSWYGATAFCNYYGYRLPTEWEWQAVADYDGSYTYGCGTSIDHSKANYDYDDPLGLSSCGPRTTPVNYYSSYGYGMCDMAGNVQEWTDSYIYHEGYYVLRGGCWYFGANNCSVSYQNAANSDFPYYFFGFRVVLDLN